MEKNYIIRQEELRKKIRRDFHRPTRAERDPKAYSRKEKHRTFHPHFIKEAEQVSGVMVKLVDTPDLKSCDRLVVWVRFPLTPPNAGLAQMVERFTCNEDVVGSIPTTGSI